MTTTFLPVSGAPFTQYVPDNYENELHPITKKSITGWEWDKTAWPDEQFIHMTAEPVIFDAAFSGVTSEYWQSGIGGGEDLDLQMLYETYVSGMHVGDDHVHEWIPQVKHGHYFLGPYRHYLHSDDSMYVYPEYALTVSGVDVQPYGSINYIPLSVRSKPGVPITARQYRWDGDDNKYDVYIEARQRAYFTGTRDDDNVRQSTFDSARNAILYSNIDTSEPEFVSYFSGQYASLSQYLIFNRHLVQRVGDFTDGGGELLGYTQGGDDETFHTTYAPLDRTMPVEVNTYLTVSGVFQTWEVVSGLNTILTGHQVGIDFDEGLIRFPGASGEKATAGCSVEASYWKTFRVEYEPEQACDTVECLEGNANPIKNYADGGFLFLTDDLKEPASIILEAELEELASDYYGPLYIGNALAKLVATVYDKKGLPAEGETVTFTITTSPAIGSLGRSTDTVEGITNWEGEAKAFYRSPGSIDDLGEHVTAAGTIDNAPPYDGVTQTTTFTTYQVPFVTDVDNFFIFKNWADDPAVGYKDTAVADDLATQLTNYYEEFLTEKEVYGPTGIEIATGNISTGAQLWETTYRQLWDLLRPVIYTGTEGRKVLVVAEDDDALDPHEFNSPAIAPFQPIDIIPASGTIYNIVFDTSTYTLDAPTGQHVSYFMVAPAVVALQASVYVPRTKKTLTSNEIEIKLDIPPHMNGTYLLDDLNAVDLTEISPVLAAKDESLILNKKIIFGLRLKSANITLASALGGITFLDVNQELSPEKWPCLGYYFTVSGIA